jgi:hypothetical protein
MMTMKKFAHALIVVAAYIGMGKFGYVQIAIIQKKIKNSFPLQDLFFPVLGNFLLSLKTIKPPAMQV